jgi:hypothetical protein
MYIACHEYCTCEIGRVGVYVQKHNAALSELLSFEMLLSQGFSEAQEPKADPKQKRPYFNLCLSLAVWRCPSLLWLRPDPR